MKPGKSKPDSFKIQEPRWQQIVSILLALLFGSAWLYIVFRSFLHTK